MISFDTAHRSVPELVHDTALDVLAKSRAQALLMADEMLRKKQADEEEEKRRY